jgi:hypothetical protein
VIASVLLTPVANLDSTGQFLAATNLYQYELPPLIKDFFDVFWNIDNLAGRDYFVVSLHVPVVQFVKPETIFLYPKFVQIRYF